MCRDRSGEHPADASVKQQRGEFDRWDAVVADDVLVNSPALFGQRGLQALKAWAAQFVRLGNSVDLILYLWSRN